MRTWIFQGNPDDYDIDGDLVTRPAELLWLVTRYASDIAVGDRVYLWRNQGKSGAVAGVIAEGIVISPPALRNEDPNKKRFWRVRDERADSPQMRAGLRLIKVATSREVIRRDWCLDDPILQNLPNLRMQAGTNYPLDDELSLRLAALWSRTGRDWNRNESIAGLWAYAETYGQPVSKLPDSPVAQVALTIGRAISGVYAKVMNYRSIDPRAHGHGMSGAGQTDRDVWKEYFDPLSSTLRVNALKQEFNRLWLGAKAEGRVTAEATAVVAIIADEAGRLEGHSLEELLAKYREQSARRRSGRPSRRALITYEFDRNPLVITIARKRAAHRCELRDCGHPTFETLEGLPYTEVHHIEPLAEGGEDTIENVACVCAAHHRQLHLGKEALQLTEQLKAVRNGHF